MPEEIVNPTKVSFSEGSSKEILEKRESLPDKLFNFEKKEILKALQEDSWNITKASKALKISRQNLQKRMRKFKLKLK